MMSNPDTQFKPNNEANLRHGLERSVKQLQRGEPFTGPAAEAEAIVRAELETVGLSEVVKADAVRLEALGRAFYNQVCERLEANDLAEADKFVKRAGWLIMGALRAWQQVEAMAKNADDSSIVEAIASIQRDSSGDDTHAD